MQKPQIHKYKYEEVFNPKEISNGLNAFFSRKTLITPIDNAKRRKGIYLQEKLLSLCIFFTNAGIHPKINPINREFVWIGYFSNIKFSKLPNR